MTLDKFTIAEKLRQVGTLLELKGENPFRARAYTRGAEAVESLPEELGVLLGEGRLTEVEGIGGALAALIKELHDTGESPLLQRLQEGLPRGVLELSQVPGLSLKAITALGEALGISSIEALEEACKAGRVRAVKGFGEKKEQKILASLESRRTREQRVLLVDALELAERILGWLRASKHVRSAEVVGAIRRAHETLTSIELLATADDPSLAIAHFARCPALAKVESRGSWRAGGSLPSGVPVALAAVRPRAHAVALVSLTGSASHTARLRSIASSRGLELTSRSLFRLAEPRVRVSVASERALYRRLGLAPIPPELREDAGEIEGARKSASFARDLVSLEDIRGLVHCHTTYSDGRASLEEMARAADERGMTYMTVTDHSPTASYAHGVEIDRLERQWEEIARVQEKVRVKLLRGTESDILRDGSLDYPDRILEKLDVVIASIHNRYRLNEGEMTRRLVRAMRHPLYKIWGHALGRLLLRRDPIPCRMEEVLDAIAESRAAIEVNGDPYRLDMEPRWLAEARKRDIRFVISVDAHATTDMDNLHFGVSMARRGGLRRAEVLNTLDARAFARAVRPREASAH